MKIVVVGGGTGTFTVLSGLKEHDVELSDVVSMMDSGGSNRVIRDEFGLLPTSDIRQGIVALADPSQNEVLRNLFTYRFNQGTGIAGNTFANLLMAALTDIYGSQEEAIKKACELLAVRGQIIPVTFGNAQLLAHYTDGTQILGEHAIDEPSYDQSHGTLDELTIIPRVKANPRAIEVILSADMIILGPGDLFTSTICNLVVDGISEALNQTKANLVYIVNLMTKFGQTEHLTAMYHVSTLASYMGRRVPDRVIMHDIKHYPFPDEILERYKPEKATAVVDDLGNSSHVIRADIVSDIIHEKNPSDRLKRSLIRHDPDKLAKVILSLA